MPGTALSIKLRCASWQQLATIYKRDLSKGTMFLKATNQPPLGTIVKIDLELPSASVIELVGAIAKHVTDPQRGTGVELKLEPLPTKSVWMIESALAAAAPKRASTAPGVGSASASGQHAAISEGQDVAAAEDELVRALEAEAESLRKLNPFLVLGVGYESTDDEVRAAFGELTKRYHPDRYTRYQSVKLRQLSAEIFILIRDAYRKLADGASRQQIVASLAPRIPQRAQTQPRGSGPAPRPAPARPPAPPPARVPTPPPMAAMQPPPPSSHNVPTMPRPAQHETPTSPGAYDAPTNPNEKRAQQLAQTEMARGDIAIPTAPPPNAPRPVVEAKSAPVKATDKLGEPADLSGIEAMLDEGKIDEALAAYRVLAKKHPSDKATRAGIELCEGLRALGLRDRLEAAQRFESALELDPSNERAARELAEMRRQATNERKGLLSRLMGKKEPPP